MRGIDSEVEIYQHAKVIGGILVGFTLTHLLGVLARIIQHPKRWQVYWIHLVWVVSCSPSSTSSRSGAGVPAREVTLLELSLLYLLCALLMPGT